VAGGTQRKSVSTLSNSSESDSPLRRRVAESAPAQSDDSPQPPAKRLKPNPSRPNDQSITVERPTTSPTNEISPSQTMPAPAGSPQGQRNSKYQRHEKHWYPDGNIIVRISSVQFRLFQGILARHSGWFRNAVFGKDKPDTAQETYEGLPVHVLSGMVRLKDFETLLDALDNAVYVFRYWIFRYCTYADSSTCVNNPPTFLVVASIFRASTVLDFTDLKTYARRVLEEKWAPPPDLKPTGSEQNEEADQDADEDGNIDISKLLTYNPYPSTTILLSRECNLPSVMPRAMYELVTMDQFGLDEVTEEDVDEEQEDENGTMRRPKLPEVEYHRLIRAREKLVSLWINDVLKPPKVEHSGPTTCVAGDPERDATWHSQTVLSSPQTGEEPIFQSYIYDPFAGLNKIMKLDWEAKGYCEQCVKDKKRAWKGMMRRWWKSFEEVVQA